MRCVTLLFACICALALDSSDSHARADVPDHGNESAVGTSYLILGDAYEAWAARDWTRLEPMVETLTAENPYKGPLWYALGDTKYSLKKYAESAEAYGRSAELGFRAGGALYNMGCCLALIGEGERAIAAVEGAILAGLQDRESLIREDTDLDSIRNTAAFRARILPDVPADVSRIDGWRIDLDYLHKRMEDTHWDLYRKVSREEWMNTIKHIKKNVASMSDDDITFELMRLFAKIEDGHTGVVPPMGDDGWRAIPVKFYIFSDGVFVREADGRYADAVGKRVVSVGGVPMEEALKRCATVTPHDNSQQIKWMAPMYLSTLQVLKGLDIVDQTDYVDAVLQDAEGSTATVRFESVPLTHEIYGGRYENKVTMRDAAPAPQPLWAKYADRSGVNYAFEYLEDENLVYFFFDGVRDHEEGESLADFSSGLHAFIKEKGAAALVIDVRLNHGGNNFLARPLLADLIRDDAVAEFGSLFVITGRETFSACQNFVNWIDRDLDAIFVGEPTASRPNFVGEDNKIILPCSGLVVRGSSRYWQDSLSDDHRLWIAPHLVAEMTSADYAGNRDPAMEVIRRYIAHEREAKKMGSR